MSRTIRLVKRLLVIAALCLIVLGGAAARFVDLGTNPGGLYPDEAAEGITARQILADPGYRPVFVPEDGGREALYAYSLAVGFGVAGESVDVIRGVAAVWGVLGILGIWLLVRRFGTGAGLAAAAWVAGSLWLIAISRDGMRNTMTPVLEAFSFLCLIAWVNRPSRSMALIAGASLAIASLYTYNPLKLLIVLVAVWLLWLRASDRPAYDRAVVHAPAFVIAFAIVAAPMVAAAISDPQAYLGRAIGVTVFNSALVPQEDLIGHVVRTLGQFGFVGDPNARHDVDALPLLGIPLTFVALVGVAVLWRGRRGPENSLVLLAFPVFLLPQLIATEGGSPHFLRGLGLVVPLAIAIGLGAQALGERMAAVLSSGRWSAVTGRAVSTTIVAALFLAVGVMSVSVYLHRPVAERYAAFSYDLVSMSDMAIRGADAVVVDEVSAYTVSFLAPQVTILRPGEALTNPAIERVLARSIDELKAAVGDAAAANAVAVAFGPAGQPTVWAAPAR